jgi:hypothetical protein
LTLRIFAAAAIAAAAQEPARNGVPRVRSFRITNPPKLDGIVDDPEWTAVEPAASFIQQEPNEGAVASERTEVRFAFDDENLYIGIICFDSDPDE